MKNLIRRHSENYNFVGDQTSGLTFRWGSSFRQNPDFAPWPELADISISNRCKKGCSFCYQDSSPNGSLMSLENYKRVLDELTSPRWGSVFQVALGGGEPTEHPELNQIIQETSKRGIVPNLTTNGDDINPEHLKTFKEHCGAIALSFSEVNTKDITSKTAEFLKTGIRTNIHFLLTKKSLVEACEILAGKWDSLFEGINAILFLTHKSMGRANNKDNITISNQLQEFLHFVDNPSTKIRFGFDACFVPLLIRKTKIDTRFVDSCECGFFSVYVDEMMNVKPCSFSNTNQYSFNLANHSFKDVWTTGFEQYREQMKKICLKECTHHNSCRGGCAFHEHLNLCF